jgi:hypothetical protein
MKKRIKINVAQNVTFPKRYAQGYWVDYDDGKLLIRYNRAAFKHINISKIKEIAEITLKVCDVWDSYGVHKAEIGVLEGIPYLSFPIIGPDKRLLVCIETREGFEKGLNVKLSDLAETNMIGDGQHKHEGL